MRKCILIFFFALLFTSSVFAAENESVKIAVIDTGISTVSINPKHITEGYNYILQGEDTEDKLGHGTAIAGILVGSQVAGVEGICPEATLVPLVYYSVDDNEKTVKGDTEMVAQAVYDAVDVYNCQVINISSISNTDTASLREAVSYAESRGVLVVSCARNGSYEDSSTSYYPAAYDTVLCVGSVNLDGSVSSFSQRNDTVDLLAPGEGFRVVTIRGTKIRADGTSYAAAFASGAAAKLLNEYPNLTPAEIRRILCGSATDICSAGYDTDSGWGVLNLDTARHWAEQGIQFRDVPEGQWYFDTVRKSTEVGLFGGVSQTQFLPNTPMTRSMLWMVLFRLDDNTVGANQAFWYTDAQLWTVKYALSDGTDPDGLITREQMTASLYRYAGYKGYNVSARTDLSRFTDASTVSNYAYDAMAWSNADGLVSGTSVSTLTPKGSATRAQVATILVRFYDNIME